jgi:hypothetical protein
MSRHRRLVVVAVLILLGTATGTAWLLTKGEKATVITAVLTLTVAVLANVLALRRDVVM